MQAAVPGQAETHLRVGQAEGFAIYFNVLPTRTTHELYRCRDDNFRVTKGNSGDPLLGDKSKGSEVLAESSCILTLIWWRHWTSHRPFRIQTPCMLNEGKNKVPQSRYKEHQRTEEIV